MLTYGALLNQMEANTIVHKILIGSQNCLLRGLIKARATYQVCLHCINYLGYCFT